MTHADPDRSWYKYFRNSYLSTRYPGTDVHCTLATFQPTKICAQLFRPKSTTHTVDNVCEICTSSYCRHCVPVQVKFRIRCFCRHKTFSVNNVKFLVQGKFRAFVPEGITCHHVSFFSDVLGQSAPHRKSSGMETGTYKSTARSSTNRRSTNVKGGCRQVLVLHTLVQ